MKLTNKQKYNIKYYSLLTIFACLLSSCNITIFTTPIKLISLVIVFVLGVNIDRI